MNEKTVLEILAFAQAIMILLQADILSRLARLEKLHMRGDPK